MVNTKDEKITLLQAFLIYIVIIHTAMLRYISAATAESAGQASWLSVIVCLIAFIPVLYMLGKTMIKFQGHSFHDILLSVFGRFIGKTLSIMYLFWVISLLGLYSRYAAEALTSTIFVQADTNLLLFIILLLTGIVLRWGLSVIARINKLIFVFVVANIAIVLFFLFLHFRPDYVTPISTLDIAPVLQSTVYPLAIYAYITPLFIFNDKIAYGRKNAGKFVFMTSFITVKHLLIMLAIIGMLGAPVVAKLKLPFFTAVQNISVFDSSAGLDSLFMSIRTMADFTLVAFFTYCVSRLIKNIFDLKSDTPLLTPILAFTFFFALYYTRSILGLALFSRYIVPYMNIAFGLALPVILFVTAKIRKMI